MHTTWPPMDKHVANEEAVLRSAASVASPIKLTICFYWTTSSHSFNVAAVNKKQANFCFPAVIRWLISVGKRTASKSAVLGILNIRKRVGRSTVDGDNWLTQKTQLWFITLNVYICLTCYAFQQEERQQCHIIGVENEKKKIWEVFIADV